jgi:hypothetical protein
MLISPILSMMSIWRLKNGARMSRGFVANFQQDISPVLNMLPRLPKDIPILILKKPNQTNETKAFEVNKNRVEVCLKYLIENNSTWRNHGK